MRLRVRIVRLLGLTDVPVWDRQFGFGVIRPVSVVYSKGDPLLYTTVESPNNGHIGDMVFVRCREMSASRRVLN